MLHRLDEMAVESEKVNGAYNVRVYKVIDAKDLVYPTVFDCELKMPNTSFVSRNHTLYTGKWGILRLFTFHNLI